MSARIWTLGTRRWIRVGGFGAALALVAAIWLSGPARAASATAIPRCTAIHTEVWLGDGLGGGVLGGAYYPLEFSNVGRHSCMLNGYPGVSAVRADGTQVGPAGRRTGQHHARVILAPGATAHALLKIVDWGVLCSTEVRADALFVFPPGQTISQEIPFPIGACAHRSVLLVGPVRGGVGIPAYTTF